MLHVLTHATVARPAALAIPDAPRALMRRGVALRPPGRPRMLVRMVYEHALARYVTALLPFPVAMLIWPDLALPISQAPILMFGIVLFIETNVLSVATPEKRRALIGEAEAARALDLLRARSRDILVRLAAGRGLAAGTLHLVVEQSAMARAAPLTFLSLQADGRAPAVLELDAGERALLASLFDTGDGGLDERLLHRVNLAQNTFLRATALDARTVSAHARLAAMATRASA